MCTGPAARPSVPFPRTTVSFTASSLIASDSRAFSARNCSFATSSGVASRPGLDAANAANAASLANRRNLMITDTSTPHLRAASRWVNDLFSAFTDSKADDSKAGLRVGMLVGDMAYSDGDVREAVEAAGAELVAKVPPMSNSGRFPKTDFDLDLDADTPAATCPADVTTTTTVKTKDHKGRPTVALVFPAATCAACPLRQQCVKGSRGRKVRVSVHERRIAAARTAQTEDPDTVALLRARAKVERKIDHLQDLGMRQARYRGRRKTRLQAVLAAIVANVNRLDVLGAFETAPSTPTMAQAA
ncbi:hypothetical protein BH24ACT15_BH24ACT15_36910 [soil metagenome]